MALRLLPLRMKLAARQAWLVLRNDLRLLWRDFRAGRMRSVASVTLMALVFTAACALGLLVGWTMHPQPPVEAETLIWLFFAFMMLASAINQAVRVLFERADFDLLLSSPISPSAILFARLATMTIAAAFSVAIFLLPLVTGMVVVSRGYLCGYLVWLLLSCAVGSLGIFATLLLVRWLGARRARTWTQVLAAVLGAMIYIGFQSQNMMSLETRQHVLVVVARVIRSSGAEFIARAGRGEWLPLLGLALISLGLAVASTRVLRQMFVTGVQETGAVASRRPRKYVPARFTGGVLRATFRKDARLIVRDPVLLAQVLPSAMYIVPALFGFRTYGPGALLGPISVVIATQFSSALTAVASAGEECWDLIRMSPTSELRLRWGKMLAGMVVPLAFAVAISIALVFLRHPILAGLSLLTSASCGAACAWLQVIDIRPTPRRDILRRGRPNPGTSRSLITAGIMLLGAGGIGMAAGSHWVIATLLLGTTGISVIAVFTLAEVKPIDGENFPAPAGESAVPG